MNVTIEICVDNSESLMTAIKAGADRIELCSALALGGLTPSYGLVQSAIKLSPIPIHAMIRPRAGDFVFNDQEIDIMLADIILMKQQGVAGVVIGALTPQGDINIDVLQMLLKAAEGMAITFHRAFDLCPDPYQGLETLIGLGCTHVLTSGQQATAEKGIPLLQKLVTQANNRITIIAGAGVNTDNAELIVKTTGVNELHLSGKTRRPSTFVSSSQVKMGNNAADDSSIEVTSYQQVNTLVKLFQTNR